MITDAQNHIKNINSFQMDATLGPDSQNKNITESLRMNVACDEHAPSYGSNFKPSYVFI